MGSSGRGKRDAVWVPKVGGMLAVQLSPDDAEDLIPWLTEKRLRNGTVSDFLRQVLRGRMEAERNPLATPGGVDELAQKIAGQVATQLEVVFQRTGTLTPAQAEEVIGETSKRVDEAMRRLTKRITGDDDEDD